MSGNERDIQRRQQFGINVANGTATFSHGRFDIGKREESSAFSRGDEGARIRHGYIVEHVDRQDDSGHGCSGIGYSG